MKNGVLKKYVGTDEAVVIPDGVTEIGEAAFRFCENLKSVTIPEGVLHIGKSAFAYIGEEAFSDCENLKVYASADSYARIYAETKEISFKSE